MESGDSARPSQLLSRSRLELPTPARRGARAISHLSCDPTSNVKSNVARWSIYALCARWTILRVLRVSLSLSLSLSFPLSLPVPPSLLRVRWA